MEIAQETINTEDEPGRTPLPSEESVMSNNDRVSLMLEELKILQSIIARHDELSFRIKNWCVTLIVAMLVAIASNRVNLSLSAEVLIIVLLPVPFLYIDVLYRVAEDRAIERANYVENCLGQQDIRFYDGPKIGKSLSIANLPKDQFQSLKNNRVYMPYVIMIAASIIILLAYNKCHL